MAPEARVANPFWYHCWINILNAKGAVAIPLPAVHTGTTVAAQSYRLVLLCVSDCITKKMACDIKNFPEYFSNSLSFPEIINSLRFPGFP